MTRMGYFVMNQTLVEKKGMDAEWDDHFMGLNEAVTEKLTFEFLNKYWDVLLEGRVDYKKEDITDFKMFENHNIEHHSYKRECILLDQIIDQISLQTKEKSETIWNEVKKGYFTGDTKFTRRVEDVFGSGSFRILSEVGSSGRVLRNSLTQSTKAPWLKNKPELFLKYFDTSIPLKERQEMMKPFFDHPDKIDGQKYVKMVEKNQ